MKKQILLLSTGDINGAYEAIYRLGKHFLSEGYDVKMLVKSKTKSDDFIVSYIDLPKNHNLITRVFIKIKNKVFAQVNKQNIQFDSNYDFISTDELSINTNPSRIIDLIGFVPHFIFTGMTNGFMNSTDLLNLQQLTDAQVYNIAVDMNHFTGGCHYAWDCTGYISGCTTNCPAIISEEGKDIARRNFETKLSNAKNGCFKVIGMSKWTINQAKTSLIYKEQREYFNVNSLIDTHVFNTRSREFAKGIFNLDPKKFYILMGCQHANAKRKGFEFLVEALQILDARLTKSEKDKIEIIIVSRNNSNKFEEIPFQKQYLEYITDYRLLSLLYQATDVFVNSSIEDAGPMMVSEALACGTPVVGFDMGVVNNMVKNGYNGYKASLKDSNDLANGIYTVFNLSKEDYDVYSKNAIQQVAEYSSLLSLNKLNLIF